MRDGCICVKSACVYAVVLVCLPVGVNFSCDNQSDSCCLCDSVGVCRWFLHLMWVVGLVCGPFSVENPAGYELDASERSELLPLLRGVVVNVDHDGVREAVASAVVSGDGVDGGVVRSILPHVGVVRDGWQLPDGSMWVMFEIFPECDCVLSLVVGGHLGCLSLTHFDDGVTLRPVEVALCSAPARPFSYVRFVTGTLRAACEYKARVLSGGIPSVMEAEPKKSAPVVSQLEAILNGLSAADRGLVEARFTEMLAAVDDANAARTTAEKEFNRLKELKETDKRLMHQHFDSLVELLPEDIRKQFLVNKDMVDVLDRADPEVFHNVNNLIKCASAGMLAAAASSGGERVSKRARSEEPVCASKDADVEMAVSSALVSGGESALQRALADTFCAF